MSGKHLAAHRRRTWGQRALLAMGSLLTLGLLAAASGATYLNVRFGQLTRYETKSYVGDQRILDLDRASGRDSDPSEPKP